MKALDNRGTEKRALTLMLASYCKRQHSQGERARLCVGCLEMQSFIDLRIGNCASEERKPLCSHCDKDCYSRLMREKLQRIERQELSRLFLRAPMLAWKYRRLKSQQAPAPARSVHSAAKA